MIDETIARIDKYNPALNAVIWRNDDEARAEAKRQADIVATEPADDPARRSSACRSRSRT